MYIKFIERNKQLRLSMEMCYTVREMCAKMDAEHAKNFPPIPSITAKPVKFFVEKWDGYTHKVFALYLAKDDSFFNEDTWMPFSGMTPGMIRAKYKNIPIEFEK